ncbi:MAG: UDP-2,3-diacylglucosamine diphosphatase [Succinivibrio sp.]
MATYIIADLHLAENRPILTNALSNFYENNLYLNDRLIIIGDMFDMFVGVDKNSKFQQNIRDIILKAKKRGVQTLFMRGNRDFLMDEASAAYFGMKLIADFYCIPTVEGRALLIHGDQLCLNDRSFQHYRSLSNNPFIKMLFMALPLSMRNNIGKKIRQKSQDKEKARENQHHLSDPIVKKAGETFLKKADCSILIHGHFHVYGGEDNAFGENTHRLGLGMWKSNYSYIKIDHNTLKLVQRPMEKNF